MRSDYGMNGVFMKDREKAETNSSNFIGVVTGGLTDQGNERRGGTKS